MRRAVPEDEDSIVALVQYLYEDAGKFEIDNDLIREMLWRDFRRQDGVIGVIGPSSALEGAICMLIGRLWYSREQHLEEIFNIVHPEHRKSGHAKALIGYAKLCSDELQIPLNIGIFSNTRTEAKVRLYQRQLGKPAGAFFSYNAHFGHGPNAVRP